MHTPKAIASRVVDQDLQESFATLSGDRNPMHMDHIAARRTQAGEQVVHGVHTLLWALEMVLVSHIIVSRMQRIRVRFLKWVYLGQKADVIVPDLAIDPRSFTVEVQGMTVLAVDLFYGDPSVPSPEEKRSVSPDAPIVTALDLGFVELANSSGAAYTPLPEATQPIFPALSASIGTLAVGDFISCSYIVGMEAPGLHSMFSKLDLALLGPHTSTARPALSYQVAYLDERFRKGRISVSGGGVKGTLDVFLRVPPVKQASIENIAAKISAQEFSGMNALIIGGSRGLGELTAKIVAAGGGKSTLTYALGKIEAEAVADEICSWGGQATTLAYDVRKEPATQLAGLESPISHLFYFATNTIFKPKLHLVSAPVLADFSAFYLKGFYDLCQELMPRDVADPSDPRRLLAYYPSTVFVEDRPAGMTEYAMIKAAGEQMCRDMNQYLPGIHVIQTRLPRLPTDQTAGVLPGRDLDPIDVMLPIVRAMKAGRPPA